MKAICFFGWKHIVNVLAIIRTGEGLGFDEIILVSRKKPNFENHKTAMREYSKIKHRIKYFSDFSSCERYLEKYNIVHLELCEGATNISEYKWKDNSCIVVGHEREGIPERFLKKGDRIYIPMKGIISCMNVACSASIAMYEYSKNFEVYVWEEKKSMIKK